MNIIVTNKYKDLIISSGIEILKELNGVFKINEIANGFNSIYFKKIIIDATALANFPKEEVLRELVKRFDTEKLILFLPPDSPPPIKFLSFLVSLNLYNFTDNINGLRELVNRSNTFQDVSNYANYQEPVSIDNNKDFSYNENLGINNIQIILGIKNVTNNAGNFELIYMLKKMLTDIHHKKVIAVEINQNNFVYYNDKSLYSITSNKISSFLLNNKEQDIILVSLDDKSDANFCTDVLYLVEPSLYKINELMLKNRSVFNTLKGKKVILNKSLLSESDINTFAREAGISIYFNLPPLNDRINNQIINNLLAKLGIIQIDEVKVKKGLFDFFK